MNANFENVLVVRVTEVELRGANGYEVRNVVVKSEDNPQYPQFHVINFNGDKTDLLNKIAVGDRVDIIANINGREFEPKLRPGEKDYFNSLDGWKIKKLAGGSASVPEYAAPSVDISSSDDDDLPF